MYLLLYAKWYNRVPSFFFHDTLHFCNALLLSLILEFAAIAFQFSLEEPQFNDFFEQDWQKHYKLVPKEICQSQDINFWNI